jgi:ribosome modulation factor
MSDRIVYVHPSHTSDSVTIITPKAFDELLAEGWEIKKTDKKKIDGKGVDVYHLFKPSKERGIAVVGEGSPKRDEMGLVIRQESSSQRGLAVSNNRSFLGGSDFEGLPGVQVATSKLIQHAYSMGADAANQGQPKEACPWPAGNVAATQWLKGYASAVLNGAAGAGEIDTKDALEAGKLAAKGDADLEVHCPYPANTPHYHAWLRGFKEAGGRVE